MPIDKIICAGKNYLEHAKELGDAVPEKPVIFLKPASTLKVAKQWGETLSAKLPEAIDEAHHEIEIVLQIIQGQIAAVTLGLDMTLRERQALLKKKGHPWTTAKVFTDAAIIGPWIPIHHFKEFMQIPFSLYVNGELRQQACGNEMMMQPNVLIDYINSFFPICDHDLVFTGTPAGVGPVRRGSDAKLAWGQYHYSVEWH